MVIGQIISLDEWVPERPPKNPALRIPSPDLPPPPLPQANLVPSMGDDECGPTSDGYDEPLPPPPPEVLSRHVRQLSEPDTKQATPSRRNSFAGQSTAVKPLFRGAQLERQSPPSAAVPPAVPKKMAVPSQQQHYQQSVPMRSYPMSVYPHNSQQQQPTAHRAIAICKQPLNGITTTLMPMHKPLGAKLDDLAARQLEGSRLTMRKRSHNAPLTPVEMPAVNAKLMMPPSPPQQQQQQQQPPPLMPRIPQMAAEAIGRSASAMGNRLW